jgi:hypothetical protein
MRSRRPAPGRYPTAPVGGWLYRVAYVTTRGETYSRLFRQQQPALDYAAGIVKKGGNPRVDRIRLTTSEWGHLDMWTFEWRATR